MWFQTIIVIQRMPCSCSKTSTSRWSRPVRFERNRKSNGSSLEHPCNRTFCLETPMFCFRAYLDQISKLFMIAYAQLLILNNVGVFSRDVCRVQTNRKPKPKPTRIVLHHTDNPNPKNPNTLDFLPGNMSLQFLAEI